MAALPNDLVAQVIQAYVADELRAYKANLTSAIHIVENQWLPTGDESGVQEHLSALRQHLVEIGHPEDDSFLLRLGLTAPGVQRGIIPPLMVLEKNRGGFSTRRHREAEGQILRLREALTIGWRFLPGLSHDLEQAIAQLADVCQRQSSPNDTIRLGWFGALTAEEAKKLEEFALGCVDGSENEINEIGTTILQCLACFRQPALSEACGSALIEREVFWPASMYRDSGEAIALRLISHIEDRSDASALNYLLLALGYTRSVAAREAFLRWSHEQPAWASALHVPPQDYLQSAGWCLDEDGGPRDLISMTCCRLIPAEDGAVGSILCRRSIKEKCPSCGARLAWLFDFSQVGEVHFPGEFSDAPRKVLCCLHCSCYGPVFTRYRPDGTSEWLSPHEPCEFEFSDGREPYARKCDDATCPPFAFAEPIALTDASTLGGVPMWVQNAEYPHCIECGQLMTFLAQHDNSPLGEEGIYYAFFCAPCRVAAVTYQQT